MFSIPATVEDGVWSGPPYTGDAKITGWYADYPGWRQSFDHDSDPSTPPIDMGPHKGMDLYALDGPEQPLVAVYPGEVVWTGVHPWSPGGGYQVQIDHGDGFKTRYLHMNRIDVEVGQMVLQGDQIGIEGWTGYVTGRHCHFEVWNPAEAERQGVDPRLRGRLNPLDYLEANVPTEPELDMETFTEYLVSHYYLHGKASHGGTIATERPVFIGYADDGRRERWEIELQRPVEERPDAT